MRADFRHHAMASYTKTDGCTYYTVRVGKGMIL